MHYIGQIIRPPSEANSILLQVTVGCSHNRCNFCGTYREDKFSFKPMEQIEADLHYAARHYSDVRRLFLCDGDALILPQERMLTILAQIKSHLPKVGRVGLYANAKSIMTKTDAELLELREAGLSIAYFGLESGDDKVLAFIDKGANASEQIEQAQRLRKAGIKLSVTVLLGIAGAGNSARHAKHTGEALSQIDPEYVGALTVMLVPGTPLAELYREGKFVLPGPDESLQELRAMIQATNMSGGQFMANHASNYLPLKLKMPRDKETALTLIDDALSGNISLREEWMRGL